MDLSKKFVRQTHIIDDFDAINIAQGQRKASSKKNKQGSTGPSTHQNASSPKTKNAPKPKASQQADSRFYEKGRTRKVHARLSSSLHNTNTDCLLDTVEEYAGVEKRKEFKNADKSKAEIADWIEAKETLALGPHPRSKLTLSEENFNGDQEDALEDPLEPEDVKGNGKNKSPMYPQVQEQGKRKRDNAPEPAQDLPQTTKKLKTRHVEEHLAKQPHGAHIDINTKAKNECRKVRAEELVTISPEPQIPTISAKKVNKKVEAAYSDEQLQGFMRDIGMEPGHPDVSTMVVRLPEHGVTRVLTATMNAATGEPILHDTPIFHRAQPRGQETPTALRKEHTFLKAGVHGRHGEFKTDPDRRTGRGHQLNPEHQTSLEEYMEYRGVVLQKYPRFLGINERDEVQSEVKQSWDKNEMWYNCFTELYPGFSVGHLWPCGCEKLRGESEDEESEEE